MFSPHWRHPVGNMALSSSPGRCSKNPPAAICCDQSREIAEIVGSSPMGLRPALARTLLISPSTYASRPTVVCARSAVGSGVGSAVGSGVGVGSGMRVAVASGVAVGSDTAVAGTSVDAGSRSAEVASATAAVGCGVAVGSGVGVGAAVGCGVAANAGDAIAAGAVMGAVVTTAVAGGLEPASLGRISIDCVSTDLADSSVPDRAELAKNTRTMPAAIVAAIFSGRRLAGLARGEEVMGTKNHLRIPSQNGNTFASQMERAPQNVTNGRCWHWFRLKEPWKVAVERATVPG